MTTVTKPMSPAAFRKLLEERSEFAFLLARAFEASMSNGKGESNA